MGGLELTEFALENIKPGEAISLAAVMAVLVIGIVAVVVYRLLKSAGGMSKFPGAGSSVGNE